MRSSTQAIIVAVLLVCILGAAVGAKSTAKKGPRSNADRELRTRRSECERDVCQGLANEAKLTCTYRCVSPDCYEEIYAKDEIEEGEVDTERGRLFSSCFRRLHKKETEELKKKQREEKAAGRKVADSL